MEEQKNIIALGGTMRLGAYPCKIIDKNSISAKAYKTDIVYERHSHRYEFNNEFLEIFKKNGLKPVGINPQSNLVEIIQLENHPWFIGVQFHPEYKSRVVSPHPLFVSFIEAALNHKQNKNR